VFPDPVATAAVPPVQLHTLATQLWSPAPKAELAWYPVSQAEQSVPPAALHRCASVSPVVVTKNPFGQTHTLATQLWAPASKVELAWYPV